MVRFVVTYCREWASIGVVNYISEIFADDLITAMRIFEEEFGRGGYELRSIVQTKNGDN